MTFLIYYYFYGLAAFLAFFFGDRDRDREGDLYLFLAFYFFLSGLAKLLLSSSSDFFRLASDFLSLSYFLRLSSLASSFFSLDLFLASLFSVTLGYFFFRPRVYLTG